MEDQIITKFSFCKKLRQDFLELRDLTCVTIIYLHLYDVTCYSVKTLDLLDSDVAARNTSFFSVLNNSCL